MADADELFHLFLRTALQNETQGYNLVNGSRTRFGYGLALSPFRNASVGTGQKALALWYIIVVLPPAWALAGRRKD